MDGPWIKTVPVVSNIFDVSSTTGLGIEGYLTCWKDELGNHTLGTKAQNMDQLRVFGLNNKPSTSCHYPVLLANGSYALALDRDTKPGHHGLLRPDSRRQNLIFFTNRNILHNLKKEPLNIMLLHTSRTLDGPWIKTVPVVSRIFDVSSSTGLGIEGYLTCWKDELGNHTVGTKAQNMHQLRVLGAK